MIGNLIIARSLQGNNRKSRTPGPLRRAWGSAYGACSELRGEEVPTVARNRQDLTQNQPASDPRMASGADWPPGRSAAVYRSWPGTCRPRRSVPLARCPNDRHSPTKDSLDQADNFVVTL